MGTSQGLKPMILLYFNEDPRDPKVGLMGSGAKSRSSGPGVSASQSRGEGRGPPTPDWPLCLNECCLRT